MGPWLHPAEAPWLAGVCRCRFGARAWAGVPWADGHQFQRPSRATVAGTSRVPPHQWHGTRGNRLHENKVVAGDHGGEDEEQDGDPSPFLALGAGSSAVRHHPAAGSR
jgi:hypothetical protein